MKPNTRSLIASARLHSAISALPKLSSVGFVIAAITLGASSVKAAAYTWDLSTTAGTQTGNGTWSTSAGNWSTNGTTLSNWLQTSGTAALHTATLAGADGNYAITLGGAVAAQSLTFSNSGYTLTAASPQTLTLTNAGSGIISIAANKSATIGGNATVAFNSASNTGTRVDLTNNGTLEIASGGVLTRTGQITTGFSTTGGTLGFMGNGTINVAGTLSFNVATPVANGGIVIAANALNNVTLNLNGGTVNSNSTINGLSLVASGTSGTLNVNSGLVSTTGTAGVTSGINVANGAGTTGILNLNGGTISTFQINSNYLNGSNVLTTGGNSTFNFNGGTLKAIATNAAFMSGLTAANVKSGGALIDSNGFNITIGQALLDGTGGGGLTKSGNGTLTLSGSNTYTGATAVNVGTLAVNGSLTSNVTVASGATLSGTGSTTGSLTFNSGSSFTVNPADSLAANGVNFAGNTTLNFSSALTSGSTYTVVDFGSGLLSGVSNIIKTVRGTLGTTGTVLQFTSGSVSTDTWTATSGTWQVSTSTPWSNGSDSEFWNGDTVIFDDTPGSNAAVTITGSLSPAAVTVSNTGVNYTWSGSGGLAGGGALTKNNTGSLTIGTSNGYTGGTTLNAGTIVLNNASAIGTGALNIAGGALDSSNGTTLSTNNAVNVTGDFSFAGTSNLNLGTGTVTLSGERTVTVDTGTLTVGKLINTTGGLTKSGAGTLQVNPSGGSSLNGTLTVSAGTFGIGAQDLSVTGLAGSGTIQNGSGTTRWFFVTNASDNTFNGVIQDGGVGKLGLNKAGAGALTLAGVNTMGDVVTVNDGTLRFSGSGSLANASSYFINNNAVMEVSALGQIGTGAITVNNNSILKVNASGQVGGGLLTISSGGGGIGTANRLEIGGGATLSGPITLAPRNEAALGSGVATDAIRNTGGDNTLSGVITIVAGGNQSRIQSDAGSLTLSGNITTTMTTPRNFYLQGAANGTVSGVIADNSANAAGKITLFKEGAGVWTISGISTYTGNTTVSGGTLVIGSGGSINGTAGLTVASGAGFKYNSSTPYTGGAINNNGTISGTGALNVAITLDGLTDHLAPGNSPGVQSFGANQTWSSFTYDWEVSDFTGTGAGTAFDQVAITGSLNLTGGLGAYVLNVLSLDAGNATGLVPNFSEVSRSWTIASTTGGITGFDAANWTIDATGFLNAEAGAFTLAQSGGDLVLSYAAVPEPATYAALAGLGMLGFVVYRRRRNAKCAA